MSRQEEWGWGVSLPQAAQRPDLARLKEISRAHDSGTPASGSAPSFRSVGMMSVNLPSQARLSAVLPSLSTMFTSAPFSMSKFESLRAFWKQLM